jgi:hypothetical protein
LIKYTLEKSEDAIQRHWQHWTHKTQNEDKQSKNTTQKTKHQSISQTQTSPDLILSYNVILYIHCVVCPSLIYGFCNNENKIKR